MAVNKYLMVLLKIMFLDISQVHSAFRLQVLATALYKCKETRHKSESLTVFVNILMLSYCFSMSLKLALSLH
jgi:hypothetical protein